MVAAHRAAHNNHPENSLPAIQHTIDLGVDIVELDVKVTKDNVVVLMHDATINRTTNGTGNPEDYTLLELKKFRLKKGDGTLTDETIPTFEDALLLIRDKIMVDIDIKTSHLKPIIDVIKKTKTQSQVFYFDNDYDALKEIRSWEKEAMFMPRAYSYQMADSALKEFNPKIIHIDNSTNTKKMTDLIRNNNARVWINALGSPDDLIRNGVAEEAMNRLLKYNANIIQTDEPKLLIEYLKSVGLRN
jgi:glycerophosphoryl diester phosphodiesterase